ncbi:type 1 glutamine amidotransferase domain-containing protein [Phytomonospora endophytica]|uniref:Putative intracellular protease/amidase n=1 Tax=Phytomonospora endophytica TaxID=714109 RepID=A0A841FKI3_9ACTN|nr:type 1 glutamine amidotransferase domain-containing protein [Phytomonospora endophytica]MBB6034072.1 putative intracellular protease/amidase [Phytomonospora endophytica]GIG66466.1 dihydroxyacetone kinase [Phytomonospora endophytica]
MSKHVLLALTSHGELGDTGEPTGYYVSEAAHPAAAFAKFGYELDFVSPKGGRPPADGVDEAAKDPVARAFLDDPVLSEKVADTFTPDRLKAGDFDAILFVGGHGAMWDFPGDEALLSLAAGIYERGGVVGAVCHGPAALVNLRLSDGSFLVKGRRATGFTNEEEEAVGLTATVPFLLESRLRERGADYVAAEKWAPHAIADGRLVTGQNPASATRVGELMVTALGGH